MRWRGWNVLSQGFGKNRINRRILMHIILHQPEIPANTGNIGRTCVATGTPLHLIEPLGFRLDEKSIKRAGMDYWSQLDVTRYMNYQEFLTCHPDAKSGWQPQRQSAPIRKFPMGKMTLLCLGRRAQEYRRRFLPHMRLPASGFPCGIPSAL